MLHPDFEELVKFASATGMRTAVTTNGTLLDRLDDEVIEAFDEITVSLWASSAATYARLHPNKTGRTFDRIVAAMRRLGVSSKGRGPELVIANVVGAMNHHEFEDMAELAIEVGAARLYFAVVDPVADCTDGLLLSTEVAADLRDRARSLFPRISGRVVVDNADGFLRRLHDNDSSGGRYDRHSVEEVPCLVGWGFARVMANGDVVPCCRAVHKPMGNLLEETFRSVWVSNRWKSFRQHADEPKSSSYFSDIGCDLSCDNLMHNREWQSQLDGESAQSEGES
jgi:MoaA/NifB/PqqE/SkfB family radical SAM enzyme